MIHYSCDRCGRPIDSKEELRYIVRVEVEAVMEPLDGVIEDEDRDHLMTISEILERAEDLEDPMIGEGVYDRKRFDLCSDCHHTFIKSPVGSSKQKQMNFSSN